MNKRIIFVLLILILLITFKTAAEKGTKKEKIKINVLKNVKRVEPGQNITIPVAVINQSKNKMVFRPQVILPEGFRLISSLSQIELLPSSKKLLFLPLKINRFTESKNYLIKLNLCQQQKTGKEQSMQIFVNPVTDIKVKIASSPDYVKEKFYLIRYKIMNKGNTVEEIFLDIEDNLDLDIFTAQEKIKLLPGEVKEIRGRINFNEKEELRGWHRVVLKVKKEKGPEILDQVESKVKIISSDFYLNNYDKNNLNLELKGNMIFKKKVNINLEGRGKIFENLNTVFKFKKEEDFLHFSSKNAAFTLGTQPFYISPLTIAEVEGRGIDFKYLNKNKRFHLMFLNEEQVKNYAAGLSWKWNKIMVTDLNYIFFPENKDLISFENKFSFKDQVELFPEINFEIEKAGSGLRYGLNLKNKRIFSSIKWKQQQYREVLNIDNKLNYKNYRFRVNYDKKEYNKSLLSKIYSGREFTLEKKVDNSSRRGIFYKNGKINSFFREINSHQTWGIYDKKYKKDNIWVYQELGKKNIGENSFGFYNTRLQKNEADSFHLNFGFDFPLKSGNAHIFETSLKLHKNFGENYKLQSEFGFKKVLNNSPLQLNTNLNFKFRNKYQIELDLRHFARKTDYSITGKYTIPFNINYSYNQNSFSGRLKDDKGKGVAGVPVKLNQYTTVTGKSGNFTFKNIPEGEYYLTFSSQELDPDFLIFPAVPYRVKMDKQTPTKKIFELKEKGKLVGKIKVVSPDFSVLEEKNIVDNTYQTNQGELMKNIFIKISYKNNNFMTRVEANGDFEFKNIYPGKWKVEIINENQFYKILNQKEKIRIKPGQVKAMEVRIKPVKRKLILQQGNIIEG